MSGQRRLYVRVQRFILAFAKSPISGSEADRDHYEHEHHVYERQHNQKGQKVRPAEAKTQVRGAQAAERVSPKFKTGETEIQRRFCFLVFEVASGCFLLLILFCSQMRFPDFTFKS